MAGDTSATVSWSAAQANGAAVTSYVLTWSGGSKTVGGSVRSTQVSFAAGSAYTFTIHAVNRVGSGPGVSTSRICPACVADAPGNFRVRLQSAEDEEHMFSWSQPDLNGGTLVEYVLIRDFGANTKEVKGKTSEHWGGLTDGKTFHFTVQAVTTSPDGKLLMGKTSALDLTVDYDGGSGGGGAGGTEGGGGARGATIMAAFREDQPR